MDPNPAGSLEFSIPLESATMTHRVMDGCDLGKLDDGCMRLQLQNPGFPVDNNMLSQIQIHYEGFPVDDMMLSQIQIHYEGFPVNNNMLSQTQMHEEEYATNDDVEMADTEMIDDIVAAHDRLSYQENTAHEADNDIEMSDGDTMDDAISTNNTISPQGEDGEDKVGEDADENAINAAPAPHDYMTQYRIMFLAFNPPPAVPIDPSQRSLFRTAPIEIRHMIYEQCLPKARTVNFDLINSPRASRQREYKFTIPGLFQVDSDSRTYWNKKYTTIHKPHVRTMHKFYGTRNPMPLIFNPKIDTASITFLNKIPEWGYTESQEWLRQIDSSLPNGLACVRFLDIREVCTKRRILDLSDLEACFFPPQFWSGGLWTLFGGLEKLYFTASNVGTLGKRKLKEPDFARLKNYVLLYRNLGVTLGIQNQIPANDVVVRSFVEA